MTGQGSASPWWDEDPCPSWCTRDHHYDDHPQDRYHDSVVEVIPVVIEELVTTSDAVAHEHEATGLMIVSSRRRGETSIWTYIGEPAQPRQYLRLSLESAQRLAGALTQHLVSVAG